MLYRIFCFLMVGSLMSCASTTTIRAVNATGNVDRGVKVYVDGQYKGKGEVIHSDVKIVGSSTSVNMKKEGCQNQTASFSRTESLNVGALIGGIFIWPVLLWVMGYNPVHNYEFQCE